MVTGRAEVSTKPDAGIQILVGRLRETVIRTKHTTRCRAGGNAEAEIIAPEEVGQYLRRRAANIVAAGGGQQVRHQHLSRHDVP